MFGWEYILTIPYDNLVFRWLPRIDLPSLQTADDGKADNRDLVCYVYGNIYNIDIMGSPKHQVVVSVHLIEEVRSILRMVDLLIMCI